MNNNETANVECIDRFLNGELEGEELAEFYQKQESDPVFAQEVADYTELVKGFRTLQAEHLMAKLKEFDAKETVQPVAKEPTKTISISRRRSFMYVAAAAVIFAILTPIGINYFNNGEIATTESLFADNFTKAGADPLEDFVTQRGSSDNAEDTKEIYQAIQDYKSGAYASAITHFKQYLGQVNPTNREGANLYMGISQLLAGQTEQAGQTLKLVEASTNADYHDLGQWYLLLTYLKSGSKAQATELAKHISDDASHEHAQQAKEILKSLKHVK